MKGLSVAVDKFGDYHKIDKRLCSLWESMHIMGEIKGVRSVIQSSWKRCIRECVSPVLNEAPIVYSGDSLKDQQDEQRNLLNVVQPYMETLYQQLAHHRILVMLADSRGIIIDGRANTSTWKQVYDIHFFPGADWSETHAGTNAVGTSIVERKPVQVFGAEHFCNGWHNWVCTAVPIIDPVTQHLLGVFDLTGLKDEVQAHSMPLMVHMAHRIQTDLMNRFMVDGLKLLGDIAELRGEAFLLFDHELRVIHFNKRARQLFQMVRGKKLTELFHMEIPLQELQEWSGKDFRIQSMRNERESWLARIQPYYFGARVLGGAMVLRQKEFRGQFPAHSQQTSRYTFDSIVTNHESMHQLISTAKKAATTDNTILITGETGVGKELFAHAIHAFSERCQNNFVAVNCGAVPRDLLASELFGYEPGAFTGASAKGKKGKFLQAQNGTLFLDEIGEMPLDAQVYLLRVLEEKVVVPVGGTTPIPIDVRIIAATNRNLRQEVLAGKFRQDLFYRLQMVRLQIPPLRERREDIPLLARKFLQETASFQHMQVTDDTMQALMRYDWPGNIRELKSVLVQAQFAARSDVIRVEDLPAEVRINAIQPDLNKEASTVETGITQDMRAKTKPSNHSVPVFSKGRGEVVLRSRRSIGIEAILQALDACNNNVSEAARLLGVSRMTIYRKLRQSADQNTSFSGQKR